MPNKPDARRFSEDGAAHYVGAVTAFMNNDADMAAKFLCSYTDPDELLSLGVVLLSGILQLPINAGVATRDDQTQQFARFARGFVKLSKEAEDDDA